VPRPVGEEVNAYIGSKLNVYCVNRKVHDWSMTTDVEDGLVILHIDLGQPLCMGKFLLDLLVLQEFDAVIVCKHLFHTEDQDKGLVDRTIVMSDLDAILIDWGIWSCRGGKVDMVVGCENVVRVGSFW